MAEGVKESAQAASDLAQAPSVAQEPFYVQALYDYSGSDPSSLSFQQNDVIEVLSTLPTGWWDGILCRTKVRGWFPSNYVHHMSEEESAIALDQMQDWWDTQGNGRRSSQASDELSADENHDGNDRSEGVVGDYQSIFSEHSLAGAQLEHFGIKELSSLSDGGDLLAELATAAQEEEATDLPNTTHTPLVPQDISVTSSERDEEEDDYWMPKVDELGIISYYNTRTGETSQDLAPAVSDRSSSIADHLAISAAEQLTLDQTRLQTPAVTADSLAAAYTRSGPITHSAPAVASSNATGFDAQMATSPRVDAAASISTPVTLEQLAEKLSKALKSLVQAIDLPAARADLPPVMVELTASLRAILHATGTYNIALGRDSRESSSSSNSTIPSHLTQEHSSTLRLFAQRTTSTLTKLSLSVRAVCGILEDFDEPRSDEEEGGGLSDERLASIQAGDKSREDQLRQERANKGSKLRNDALSSAKAFSAAVQNFLREYLQLTRSSPRSPRQSHYLLKPRGSISISTDPTSRGGTARRPFGAEAVQCGQQFRHALLDSLQELGRSTAHSSPNTTDSQSLEQVVEAVSTFLLHIDALDFDSQIDSRPLHSEAGPLDILSTDVDSIAYEATVWSSQQLLEELQAQTQRTRSLVGHMILVFQGGAAESRSQNVHLGLDEVTLSICEILQSLLDIAAEQSRASSVIRQTRRQNLDNRGHAAASSPLQGSVSPSPAAPLDRAFQNVSSAHRESGDSEATFSESAAPTLSTISSSKQLYSPIPEAWAGRRGSAGTESTNFSSHVDSQVTAEKGLFNKSHSKTKIAQILGTDRPPSSPSSSRASGSLADIQLPWLGSDYRPDEISLGLDGQVKGGTLHALIVAATSHEGRVDSSYLSTFLMTYRTFCTSHKLLNHLADRYAIEPPEDLTEEELVDWRARKQKLVRARVANMLKTWVRDYIDYAATDTALLQRIADFATNTMRDSVAPQIIRAVEGWLAGAAPRQVGNLAPGPLPPSIVPRTFRKIRFADIDPLELARQLTIMDASLFGKITAQECLGKAWPKEYGSDAPNISAMIDMSNAVTRWVCESVLQQDDAKKRASLIKHFILIADRCLELNNFSTLIHLMAGLTSSPIHRLKRTWSLVSQKYLVILGQLNDLMRPDKNYSAYRERLRQAAPPCVPFLGVYLTDWTFIGDGNPDMLREKPHQINWQKRQKASELILMIKLHQATTYNLATVPSLTKFLDEALFPPNAQTGAAEDQRLYDLSLQREPRERDDEKIARLLSESGFL